MDVSADAVSLLPESVKITSTEPSPSKSAGPSAAADLIPLQTRLCHESLFGTFESRDAVLDWMRSKVPDWSKSGVTRGILTVHDVDTTAAPKEALAMLMSTQSWRAVADLAKQILLHVPPVDEIMEIWHYRLLALIRLRHVSVFRQELQQLLGVFGIESGLPMVKLVGLMEKIRVPFEFMVLCALTPSLSTDGADGVAGTLEKLLYLVHYCQLQHRVSTGTQNTATSSVWTEREVQLKILVASQLASLKEYTGVRFIMNELMTRYPEDLSLRCAAARFDLQLGDIVRAQDHFSEVERLVNLNPSPDAQSQEMLTLNKALYAMGTGEWATASSILTTLVTSNPSNYLAMNNLCVCMLYSGKLQEAISLLESLVDSAAPQVASACGSIVFNLTTLYELASEQSNVRKRKLLENIVKFAGDDFPLSMVKI